MFESINLIEFEVNLTNEKERVKNKYAMGPWVYNNV